MERLQIEIDNGSGFCFGVTTAIKKAEEELAKGTTLYCLGDIVHNGMECERLRQLGLVTINHEQMEQLHDVKVLLRAHGEPPETYELARRNNIEIIDATCPVVLQLQKRIKAQYLGDGGRVMGGDTHDPSSQIVIFGKRGHAEVLGLVGQTQGKAIVIEEFDDVKKLDFSHDIYLYSQTTKSLDEFHRIIAYIQEHIAPTASFRSFDIMFHMIRPNVSLCLVRNNRRYEETYFISNGISDKSYLSSNDDITVFPLYAYKENMGEEERIVNFNKDLYDEIAKGLNDLPCYDDNVLVDPTSEYNGVLYPQDLFDYIYAVLHSPSYRERYKEFLKIDFPRIPYPTEREKYRDLVEKGEELRQLHLMEDLPHSTEVTFPVIGSSKVDCYRWQQNRVYINSEQYFEGVPESAWNFYIGGYQPAQKWLKDRKG